MKTRKLPEYYQFLIKVFNGDKFLGVLFTDLEKNSLPESKSKLTPAQWQKAKMYLNRELKPFRGYQYTLKKELSEKYNVPGQFTFIKIV